MLVMENSMPAFNTEKRYGQSPTSFLFFINNNIEYELLMNHKDALLAKYSGSTIQNIIGFILSKQLCDHK
ncbi:MAG: hypothetical protein HXK87_09845 [Lachnospiraceae bacterium]|nr:hypothetical protein [Lachnospiraceae bacterium]